MLRSPFDISFERLPDTLPIFPLNSILLLPGGQIPLNIFETRYVNMVQDALAAHDRMIGVILEDKKSTSSAKKPGFFKTGCAGRITSFEETFDGRFLITITGYCRFNLKEEIATTRKYRRFKVDWANYSSDLVIEANPKINKEKLIDLLKQYVHLLSIDMDWQAVDHTPTFSLVTFFSMSLPFSDHEKQELLNAKGTIERSETLIFLLEGAIKNLNKV